MGKNKKNKTPKQPKSFQIKTGADLVNWKNSLATTPTNVTVIFTEIVPSADSNRSKDGQTLNTIVTKNISNDNSKLAFVASVLNAWINGQTIKNNTSDEILQKITGDLWTYYSESNSVITITEKNNESELTLWHAFPLISKTKGVQFDEGKFVATITAPTNNINELKETILKDVEFEEKPLEIENTTVIFIYQS